MEYFSKSKFDSNNEYGFTLLELLVSISIFLLIIGSAGVLLVSGHRSNKIIWSQLTSQADARRVLQQVVDDVRRAETSNIGSYSIVTASSTEFSFYANIDDDSLRELVRFWLDGEEIKKGIIKPAGIPLSYVGQTESVVTIARDIINISEDIDLFSYYGQSYAGTSTPLVAPVTITDIRVVKVSLEIEEDPISSPAPLSAATSVQIRNLKGN